MQIKENVRDVALFVFGSLLTCALILASSHIQVPDQVAARTAPHLAVLASRYPDVANFAQQLVRLTNEPETRVETRVDFGLAPNQSLCWDLTGTELDLISVLDNGRFVKPEAPLLYTDISAEAVVAQDDDTIMDCRYEVLTSNTQLAVHTSEQHSTFESSFATSATRLFCETLESIHQLNPTQNHVVLASPTWHF